MIELGIVYGTVRKTGQGDFGAWFTVEESGRKKDGSTYKHTQMCSTKDDAPPVGAVVLVQGYLRHKLDEYKGEQRVKTTLNNGQWTMLSEERDLLDGAALVSEEPNDGDQIPF